MSFDAQIESFREALRAHIGFQLEQVRADLEARAAAQVAEHQVRVHGLEAELDRRAGTITALESRNEQLQAQVEYLQDRLADAGRHVRSTDTFSPSDLRDAPCQRAGSSRTGVTAVADPLGTLRRGTTLMGTLRSIAAAARELAPDADLLLVDANGTLESWDWQGASVAGPAPRAVYESGTLRSLGPALASGEACVVQAGTEAPWSAAASVRSAVAAALMLNGESVGLLWVPGWDEGPAGQTLVDQTRRLAAHASWLIEVVTLEQMLRATHAMRVTSTARTGARDVETHRPGASSSSSPVPVTAQDETGTAAAVDR